MARTKNLTVNLNAFLDAIALSELGAEIIAESDDGYDVMVGSTPGNVLTFPDYSHHPDVFNRALDSTAAGRYQILYHNAVYYLDHLNLPDFGPESQDAIAVQMIDECHALDDIEAGNTSAAFIKCASRWASLPDSPYGQHTNRMSVLLAAYQAAGGTTTEA